MSSTRLYVRWPYNVFDPSISGVLPILLTGTDVDDTKVAAVQAAAAAAGLGTLPTGPALGPAGPVNELFRLRGAWTALTHYYYGDMVTQGGILYAANLEFTSGATFSATNWTQVALYDKTTTNAAYVPFGQPATARIPVPVIASVSGPAAVAAGGGSDIVGMFLSPRADGSFTGDTGPDPGFFFGLNLYTAIGGTTNTSGLTEIIGTLAEVAVEQTSGTLPTVFGLEASVSLMGAAAGATITQAASLHVAAPARRGGASGGSIGTAYGLKVDAPTIGGANFSIFAEAGAPARFSDRVDVNGNISNINGTSLTIYGGVTSGAALDLGDPSNAGNATILLAQTGSSFLVYASGVIPFQAWKTGDAAMGASGAKVGFLGTAPIAKRATTADATDLASVITLANALKADLQAYGLKS